jgi:hypothetical protein
MEGITNEETFYNSLHLCAFASIFFDLLSLQSPIPEIAKLKVNAYYAAASITRILALNVILTPHHMYKIGGWLLGTGTSY